MCARGHLLCVPEGISCVCQRASPVCARGHLLWLSKAYRLGLHNNRPATSSLGVFLCSAAFFLHDFVFILKCSYLQEGKNSGGAARKTP